MKQKEKKRHIGPLLSHTIHTFHIFLHKDEFKGEMDERISFRKR